MNEKRTILTKDIIEKKLKRIAYEIVERNSSEEFIILAGIKESGYVIANKLHELLTPLFKGKIELISVQLDKKNPAEITLNPTFNSADKVIILVDDVANTGRTILYAMKPLLDLYPKKIQTVVLVERTHKQFPVNSDYVGLSISTTLQDHIIVDVEKNEVLSAYLQ